MPKSRKLHDQCLNPVQQIATSFDGGSDVSPCMKEVNPIGWNNSLRLARNVVRIQVWNLYDWTSRSKIFKRKKGGATSQWIWIAVPPLVFVGISPVSICLVWTWVVIKYQNFHSLYDHLFISFARWWKKKSWLVSKNLMVDDSFNVKAWRGDETSWSHFSEGEGSRNFLMPTGYYSYSLWLHHSSFKLNNICILLRSLAQLFYQIFSSENTISTT